MKKREPIVRVKMASKTKRSLSGADQERDIALELHRAIAERRLPPGTKLASEQLAEIFDVSRARIRSVLQALARDKVVTLEPNRGAFVSKPSPVEARNVFAARKLVEVAMARAVAGQIDENGIERLRAQVAFEAAAEQGSDKHLELKVSHNFHVLLAELHGNPVVTDYVAELTARSELITAIYERSDADPCTHAGHEALIEVLRQGDGDAFAAGMLEHLEEIEARLLLEGRDDAAVDLRQALGRGTQRGRGGRISGKRSAA